MCYFPARGLRARGAEAVLAAAGGLDLDAGAAGAGAGLDSGDDAFLSYLLPPSIRMAMGLVAGRLCSKNFDNHHHRHGQEQPANPPDRRPNQQRQDDYHRTQIETAPDNSWFNKIPDGKIE